MCFELVRGFSERLGLVLIFGLIHMRLNWVNLQLVGIDCRVWLRSGSGLPRGAQAGQGGCFDNPNCVGGNLHISTGERPRGGLSEGTQLCSEGGTYMSVYQIRRYTKHTLRQEDGTTTIKEEANQLPTWARQHWIIWWGDVGRIGGCSERCEFEDRSTTSKDRQCEHEFMRSGWADMPRV